MARWDWYEATVHDACPSHIVALLQDQHPDSDIGPGRPKHGYLRSAAIVRGDTTLAEVWWDGNPGVHVYGTAEHSPAVQAALRAGQLPHKVTRCDSCVDWREVGLFDRLSSAFMAYASENRITISQVGDWYQGKARTLYLGSKRSPVMLRLYEKGHQMGTDPSWVRLEVVVRPKGSKREVVSTWEPSQAFGASRWLVELLQLIGWDDLEPQSVGTVWRPSDTQRARSALVKQYGAILEAWADEIGWENLPDAIEETRKEHTALKRMYQEIHA